MDKLLTMSNREITRLEAMQRIKDKRLTQKEAARMLSLSVRQVKRLYRAYKAQGARGLVSQRRGKPSNNRLDAETQQKAIDLITKHYRGLWTHLSPREADGEARAPDIPGKCAQDHDRRRDLEAKTGEKPSRTRCVSDELVLGSWCRSTARITTGSKGGAEMYPAGVY
jgi:hypothetical protein